MEALGRSSFPRMDLKQVIMTKEEIIKQIHQGIDDLLKINEMIGATGQSFIRIDSIDGIAKNYSISTEKRACISKAKCVK